jgi:MFS family permease
MTASLTPWRVVLAGMLCLAVAMGIGRFAFTPLLPMMLHDGVVDLPGASWLASANYIGYLLGALACTALPWVHQRWSVVPRPEATRLVRLGLALTCVLTLGMVLPLAPLWPLLRFLAGVASALVFVFVSSWCMGQLTRLGRPTMGAMIFMGPGSGIALSGLAAMGMVTIGGHAWHGWLVFGVIGLGLTALVWPTVSSRHALPAAAPVAAGPSGGGAARHGPLEMSLLTVAYGLAGFGYIITATFLPVIARQNLPPSIWLDLFWPIFGAGVVIGAWAASRLPALRDQRAALIACYLMQAAGVTVGLVWPSLMGFALGSLLLGLPFTAITFFAIQEVRRVQPQAVASWTGTITAAYGLGQIIGPPLASQLVQRATSAATGFDHALSIAAATLLAGALMFAGLMRGYPVPR